MPSKGAVSPALVLGKQEGQEFKTSLHLWNLSQKENKQGE